MKPRIHVDTEEGRYATAHDLWIPGEKASPDYFSHKPVKDLDFDKPATRAWFFNPTLQHSFETGIVGWWNDEADEAGGDTQFLNMERALYDGQRAHSDTRVFSLNRNFWLGAQRYAYGLWSGDIQTGFATMARQRSRMLSAIDVGEMWWSMDGGGFHGHPSDENYARWIEFGAFTPDFPGARDIRGEAPALALWADRRAGGRSRHAAALRAAALHVLLCLARSRGGRGTRTTPYLRLAAGPERPERFERLALRAVPARLSGGRAGRGREARLSSRRHLDGLVERQGVSRRPHDHPSHRQQDLEATFRSSFARGRSSRPSQRRTTSASGPSPPLGSKSSRTQRVRTSTTTTMTARVTPMSTEHISCNT